MSFSNRQLASLHRYKTKLRVWRNVSNPREGPSPSAFYSDLFVAAGLRMPPPWRLAVNSSRRPNIENLRKQAKTLLRDWQQGDSAAKERVAAIKPDKSDVSLQSVQFILAREYGFRS